MSLITTPPRGSSRRSRSSARCRPTCRASPGLPIFTSRPTANSSTGRSGRRARWPALRWIRRMAHYRPSEACRLKSSRAPLILIPLDVICSRLESSPTACRATRLTRTAASSPSSRNTRWARARTGSKSWICPEVFRTGWRRSHDQIHTPSTDPEMPRALILMVREAGARRIIVVDHCRTAQCGTAHTRGRLWT